MTTTAMTVTRAQVVQAARGWLSTPFHHQARVKGVAVDCVGLVIGLARELGLVAPNFDVTAYPRMPDGTSLMQTAALHMQPAVVDMPLQPGQVIVVAFDADPQHLGILGDYRHGGLSIIHAAARAQPGRVIETRLMFSRSMRFVAGFNFPGVVS